MNEMNLIEKNYEQFNIIINEMQFSFYHEKNENNKTRTKKEQQKKENKTFEHSFKCHKTVKNQCPKTAKTFSNSIIIFCLSFK